MTKSKRKFYRTMFHVEVLSAKPLPHLTLSDDVEDEPHHRAISASVSVEIDAQTLVVLLRKQGGDPGDFQLTSSGEDVDDGGD